MLRAITSYFFGGIQDETPEAPIECETQEVNDWLVVNLPDQNKEEIDLNDEDNTNEMDEDVTNEMDKDDTTEVDEIDITEINEDEISEVDEIDISDVGDEDTSEVEEDDTVDLFSRVRWPVFSHYEYIPTTNLDRHLEEDLRWVAIRHEFKDYEESPLQYQMPPFVSVNCYLKDVDCGEIVTPRKCMPKKKELVPVQPTKLMQNSNCFLTVTALVRRMHGKRNDRVSEFERKFRNLKSLTCPTVSMTSKDYVNHRHPEKPQNNDLLQRIKELEPEQQAVQRSIKKNITRGQLNRQNKNYMYDTSSKKNRRCNRQRNHSGANNNRKC